ncbi:hypothetical protein PsorP6_009985 [Peronosclerospora sorghi]|uniref:Uncharacterized protein n=1 Tax=Peronosclerospora sorghi TaxID=230839 RepID=A0ACC0VY69_9STRA|nr:hypothetical protein PsorP6_009985 [Peronosclerospora sorghi]
MAKPGAEAVIGTWGKVLLYCCFVASKTDVVVLLRALVPRNFKLLEELETTCHDGRIYSLRIHYSYQYPNMPPEVHFTSRINMGFVYPPIGPRRPPTIDGIG